MIQIWLEFESILILMICCELEGVTIENTKNVQNKINIFDYVLALVLVKMDYR